MKLTKGQTENWEYIVQVRQAQKNSTPIELIVRMKRYTANEKSQIEKQYGVKLEELPELKMSIAYVPIDLIKIRSFLESPYVEKWQFPREVKVCAS